MRKLAIASLSFSAGIFAANYILPLRALPFAAAALILLGIALLFLKRRWLLIFELAAVFAALGCVAFFVKAQFTTVAADKLNGQTYIIQCRIIDYPKVYDDYARLDVRLCGDGLPKLTAILYDNDLEMTELRPGQVIRLEAKLKSADTRYGEEYDYYNSRDIFLIASSKSSPILLHDGTHISAIPALLRHRLLSVIEKVFPQDVSAFMQSLVLGDKSALYKDTALYTDLSRAGFMHVAAVSGMHIAFLVGLIQLFFGCSARSSVLCIVLVWCFAILTGASPSAIRAAFMQSVLLMAPILRRENDPVTSLSTVLALVLAKNPFAAASVSLQLSFGAIAGILIFNGRISSVLMSLIRGERAKKLLRYPVGILSVSLSVLPFTLALTAVHFGQVSVLSPLSNMAALWAVSFAFSGGFICCILGLVSVPLATFAAQLVAILPRFIFAVASFTASFPFAVVYLEMGLMKLWLCLSYLVFGIFALSKAKPWVKLFCPLLFAFVMLFSALSVISHSYRQGEGSIAVVDVGQGQSIAALSGDYCLVVDCGGGAKPDNAGELTGAYLLSRGRQRIDTLMLTHLHSDHANGVCQLMELVEIGEILLPAEPVDDDGILEEIEAAAAKHGISLRFIDDDTAIEFGKMRLELFKPNRDVDANEACLMCRIYINDFDMLVTADGSTAAENRLVDRHDISAVDVLVVGHHGSRYSSGVKLLKAAGADTAVISVGYNSYGHPTYETLERLEAYGYNIYRTDLNGTVEFRIG